MNPTTATEPEPFARLAAIVQADASTSSDTDADALQAAWVQALQHAGWRVGGLRQHFTTWPRGGKRMQLLDVRSAQAFDISQDLGPQARSCCLDPAGVAQASSVLRQALADRVDAVVINRFGGLEAQGGGFVAEIAALAEAGIPVLTIVAPAHLPAWRALTGPLGQELPMPQPLQALCDWFDRLQADAPTASTTPARESPA
ncbi:DUF2478 domain-containing protein [Acidovorax sp.]|uniref:DUF2478 domain-containing protein n=1 Tax=Acidovorax sp. TaxID=1872122 RepID=UPI00260E35DD|nr:DUF2478 domain-containing protein [Acidovorax sp.]